MNKILRAKRFSVCLDVWDKEGDNKYFKIFCWGMLLENCFSRRLQVVFVLVFTMQMD